MKHNLLNLTDYELKMIIWALARCGKRIHATKIACENLSMDLSKANEYTKTLQSFEIFPMDKDSHTHI